MPDSAIRRGAGIALLLRELVVRDLRSRYSGSALGFLWTFLQPLSMLAVLTFAFSAVMKIRPPGLGEQGFVPFLLCGLLPWLGFQEGVLRSTTAVVDQAALVRKLRFPREVLILSVVASAMIQQAIAMTLFFVALAFFGLARGAGLPWLAVAVPLQGVATLALGLFLGAVSVWVRDTAQVVSVVLSAWFYLTPIVYTPEMVPEGLRPWLQVNPLTVLIGLYRKALLGGAWVRMTDVAILALVATVCAAAAWWFFRRCGPLMADEL